MSTGFKGFHGTFVDAVDKPLFPMKYCAILHRIISSTVFVLLITLIFSPIFRSIDPAKSSIMNLRRLYSFHSLRIL